MSITGLQLRTRLRRRLARVLDVVADRLDPRAAPPAPDTEPEPEPAPASAPLPPLPDIPKVRAPLHATPTPKPQPTPNSQPRPSTPTEPAPTPKETPAATAAKASPEERQAKHWARTRAGLLRFVDDNGGKATLRELHDYSERTFFVAHVGFSRMMEELTDDELLEYDHDTATATITAAGRSELV